MDKTEQNGALDHVLRNVAQERDKLLGEAPVISATRRKELSEFLAREFQPEALLRKTAMNRDQLLKHPPQIPISVEFALHRELRARRAGLRRARAFYRRFGVGAWQRVFRSPVGLAVTVCLLMTAAMLSFRQAGGLSRRDAADLASVSRPEGSDVNSDENSLMRRGELLTRWASIRAFKLNTDEPASLQASFLANSAGYFADGNVSPFDLRLNLPVRTILTDDGLARTP